MIKAALVTTLILASFPVLAARPTESGTLVPADRMADYKRAVVDALSATPMTCSGGQGYTGGAYVDLIPRAQAIYVAAQGADPLLTFTIVIDSKSEQVITVKTTTDFKTLVEVNGESFISAVKNIGNLKNPEYAEGKTSTGKVVCVNNALQPSFK